MPQETFQEKQEEGISIHIFSVSAALVGVCATVLGILSVVSGFKRIETLGDEMTAIDAAFFLAACVVSYIAIKTKSRQKKFILEKTADFLFLSGLSLMVAVCVIIVRSLI